MKSFSLTLLIVMISFFSYSQAQVPNGDFENWPTQDSAAYWSCFKIDVGIAIFSTMSQTTDAHNGQYALQVETKSTNPFPPGTLEGIATLGQVIPLMNIVDGGVPFNDRPSDLYGYFKYDSPYYGDSCSVVVQFKKYNGSTGMYDEIGGGAWFHTGSMPVYGLFHVPITFTTNDMPQLMNIILYSSVPAGSLFPFPIKNEAAYPIVGSTFLVDDLIFSYTPTGLQAFEEYNDLKILPNPASDKTKIFFDDYSSMKKTVRLINSSGQCLKVMQCNSTSMQIALDDVADGLYFVHVECEGKYFSKKIIVCK